jgi:hypothetical protein
MIQLNQDRLSDVLESGTVREFKGPSIPQRGKADHSVNHGGAGGKYLEGMSPSDTSARFNTLERVFAPFIAVLNKKLPNNLYHGKQETKAVRFSVRVNGSA